MNHMSDNLKKEMEDGRKHAEWLAEIDSFRYASLERRGDAKEARRVVSYFPEYIQYVSEELKANKEFVLFTIKCNGERCNKALILKHVAKELQGDRDVVLMTLQYCCEQKSWGHSDPEYASIDWKVFRNDKEVLLEGLKKNFWSGMSCITYASTELLNDLSFMYSVIKVNERCLWRLSHRVRIELFRRLPKKIRKNIQHIIDRTYLEVRYNMNRL